MTPYLVFQFASAAKLHNPGFWQNTKQFTKCHIQKSFISPNSKTKLENKVVSSTISEKNKTKTKTKNKQHKKKWVGNNIFVKHQYRLSIVANTKINCTAFQFIADSFSNYSEKTEFFKPSHGTKYSSKC